MAFSDIITLEDWTEVEEAKADINLKFTLGSFVAIMVKDILSERMTPWEAS